MSDKSLTENIPNCGARVWQGFSEYRCHNKGRYPDGMCGIHTSEKNAPLPEEVLPEPKLNKLVVQKVSRVGIEGGPRVHFENSTITVDYPTSNEYLNMLIEAILRETTAGEE